MTRQSLTVVSLLTASLAVTTIATVAAQRGAGAGPSVAGPATVEFVATTADGQVVNDLSATQVTLRVGSRERAITSLELVQFGSAAASATATPYGTNNRAEAGRAYVVVIDEESLRPGRETAVRDALTEFERGLTPVDRLALFTIPRGSISVPPTTDREAFRSALAKVQGRAKASMSSAERRCHTRDTVTALESLMANSATAGGGVTPVLFFTTGLVGAAGGGTESPDDCIVPPSLLQRLGPAADQANAQFYLIRADEAADRTLVEGMENLVGVTGGQMFHLAGTEGGAMARVARETSSYYVASFTAEASERNGTSARVELRSSRADVTLRNRTSVLIPRGGAAPTPESMLRELNVHRQFGLRVVGIPSRLEGDAKNDMKVLALAETVDPSVKLKAAAAALYDPLGKLISQWTARPEDLGRAVLVAAIPVPSGTYRLRVAAVDTADRAATADYELNVATTSAGPAMLGGLMMGVGEKSFERPIVKITNEKEILAVFELYGRPTTPFGALVEILADATSDTALAQGQPQPVATAAQDKFMLVARIPVADLKPGNYILRARLAFQDQPMGVLTKVIRKQ